MKPLSLLFVIAATAALLGCSPKADAPAAAAPAAGATTPAPAPAAAQQPPAGGEPLAPELVARLIRPHSPILGPAHAPVTIVEFLDPACGACAAYSSVVKQIQLLFPKEVRVVVRFAAFHRGSDEAIRILDAARRQGKFEPVLDALFEGQPEWAQQPMPNLERAWQIAGAQGVDLVRARRDAADAAADAVISVDDKDLTALQVERTPTFFVNNRPLPEFSAEELMNLVKAEVERTQKAGG